VGRGAATPASVRAAIRLNAATSEDRELLVDAGVREGEVVAPRGAARYDPVDLENITPEQEASTSSTRRRRTRWAPSRCSSTISDGPLRRGRPGGHGPHGEPPGDVGHPVFPRLAGGWPWNAALDRHYTCSTRSTTRGARRRRSAGGTRCQPRHTATADAPVVQIVDLLLTQALRDRASDATSSADRLRIRFRITGAARRQRPPHTLVGARSPHDSRSSPTWTSSTAIAARTASGMTIDGRPVDIRVQPWRRSGGERWCSGSWIARGRRPFRRARIAAGSPERVDGSSTHLGMLVWPDPRAPARPPRSTRRSAS